MTSPSFDKDGYPTEETLQAIEKWPHADLNGLIEFVEQAWHDCGRWWFENKENEIHFATGGWSGNESIIDALQSNRIFWSVCWKSSARGGKFVFTLPATSQSPTTCKTSQTAPGSNP